MFKDKMKENIRILQNSKKEPKSDRWTSLDVEFCKYLNVFKLLERSPIRTYSVTVVESGSKKKGSGL